MRVSQHGSGAVGNPRHGQGFPRVLELVLIVRICALIAASVFLLVGRVSRSQGLG